VGNGSLSPLKVGSGCASPLGRCLLLSLSLWERAGVREKKAALQAPHPDPLPKGEGKRALLLRSGGEGN